ncbi:MAG: SAM-dependent methyltransferase [Bacteroidota bacterium]
MSNKGKLFLIPNVIAENTQQKVIPAQVKEVLSELRHFLVEDIRTARRYLSSLKIFPSIEELDFKVLDKNTHDENLPELMSSVFLGTDIGVISESGCPGVADPGALAVKFAHQHGVEVIPLTGPSSIILALMASGLNGQRFAFQGYLPIDAAEAAKKIREFEKESRSKQQTQIFIETPYRNNSLLQNLVKNLHPDSFLSVAVDITGSEQQIRTLRVKNWRLQSIVLPKTPAVFLFLA